MLDKLRMRTSNEEGFTLVELLVVMLIIGLLAAIAIPAFFNQRDKAKDSKPRKVLAPPRRRWRPARPTTAARTPAATRPS